jgi:hypothetical protein
MGTRVVRLVFVMTTILFVLKLLTHLLLFLHRNPWAGWLVDKTMTWPVVINPLNWPLWGGLLGIISLLIVLWARIRGVPVQAPWYQLVLPFAYVLAWLIITVIGWSRLT